MVENEYTLEELANLTGLSIRTLRFYIQEGLLPGPDNRGKYASYSEEHLENLKLILHLKEMRLSLSEIRHLVNYLPRKEVTQMIKDQDQQKNIPSPQSQRPRPSSSKPENHALDYIQNLTNSPRVVRQIHESTGFDPGNRPQQYTPKNLKSEGEHWIKIHLADGVELQVRMPNDPKTQNVVDQLVSFAKSLFRPL